MPMGMDAPVRGPITAQVELTMTQWSIVCDRLWGDPDPVCRDIRELMIADLDAAETGAEARYADELRQLRATAPVERRTK